MWRITVVLNTLLMLVLAICSAVGLSQAQNQVVQYPAMQCIWPDKAGLFPTEPGYDDRFSAMQRLLTNNSEQDVKPNA